MPYYGRFWVTGLLESRRILGRVAGVLARIGGQALSGSLQFGSGAVGERLAVAEAGNLDVEGGQPLERRRRLCTGDAEYPAPDLPAGAARPHRAAAQYPV